MRIPEKDRTILRQLAERYAAIAALPIQKIRIEQWKRMNRLERGKPMVWITEIPWPEMGSELEPQCTDPFCRNVEIGLRRTLYQWDHIQGDMVVEPVFWCPMVIRSSGFGIQTQEQRIPQGPAAHIYSHRYEPVIREEKDLEKIKTPLIELDSEATERNYQTLVNLFGDILPVKKRARCSWGIAPWDQLVTWWGVTECMVDLIERPELIHRAMDRLVSAHLAVLEQHERMGLMALNNGPMRTGSGGYGCTDLLPQKDFDGVHVRAKDLWGSATAQIFSEISPEMHLEFALKYEMRWLERFGLTYYGCCEPLHRKVHILKLIPNLRRISMSPRADVAEGAAAIGDKYVFSYKPNPAIVATDRWNPEAARRELREALEKTRGCVVEVILKDISTVRNEPRRLWEWAQIAAEETEKFS